MLETEYSRSVRPEGFHRFWRPRGGLPSDVAELDLLKAVVLVISNL